ncbi:hypothetical protein JG687_00000599 [Phytophthora cactorum]|uniref:Uncharacterized protein n=1 Tax=Phytophthora cactorum TaxID=29920 RepID=A0A8T1V365_9STRA|nr:hypothetical protein JG687_00000599 [Phytophthora cactorum]
MHELQREWSRVANKDYPHKRDKDNWYYRRRLQGKSTKATGHRNDGYSSGTGYSYVYYPNYYSSYGGGEKESATVSPDATNTKPEKANETESNKPKSSKEAMSNTTNKSKGK